MKAITSDEFRGRTAGDLKGSPPPQSRRSGRQTASMGAVVMRHLQPPLDCSNRRSAPSGRTRSAFQRCADRAVCLQVARFSTAGRTVASARRNRVPKMENPIACVTSLPPGTRSKDRSPLTPDVADKGWVMVNIDLFRRNEEGGIRSWQISFRSSS
jgi:hypothetical protein